MNTLFKAGRTTVLFATIALITTACESGTVQGYFAGVSQTDSTTGASGTPNMNGGPGTSTTPGSPITNPNPGQSIVPNGPNDGVGVSTGTGGAGNVILYGDEWVARFGDDENDSSSTWKSTMQPNLTNFWNDALGALTANSAQKRVLLARFNDAATTWDVIAASSWASYLPGLDSQYVITDYNSSTEGPLTQAFLSNYDAFIFVSYDPSLTSDLLTQYVNSGGSIMALTIGFGVPALPNETPNAANYECVNMNVILANFAYKYDCGNPNSNFVASGAFANINTASSALPFNNGYAVIPVSQAQTPY